MTRKEFYNVVLADTCWTIFYEKAISFRKIHKILTQYERTVGLPKTDGAYILETKRDFLGRLRMVQLYITMDMAVAELWTTGDYVGEKSLRYSLCSLVRLHVSG